MTDLFAGRYRLGDVVATDRTGVFHAAEDVRLQRSVTVKLIAPTRSGDTAAVDQFVREARVLGGSSEEGLVQVYDVDVRPPTPYLVTEPLRGQTLDRTLVISSALPFETAYRWITTLAEALCAAHRLGFVHAAVRPSAIFVDGDRVKLLGFGSARATGSRSSGEAEAPADVVPYVAPELLESGTIDPRIDVYALGAVAYRLLAGQPPELGGKREPPSHYTPALPAGVDVFIARALASDPQKRIQSMTQFLAGWEQLGERSLAPELPSAVPIGTLLGGSYEVRGRLGRGSFGTVLLANDSHLDRQVAIKLLHDLDEKVQAKFVAEARAMAAIDHPNVIRVYSLGDHEGVPYLVMEHVAGSTVEELIMDSGRPPLADAMSILQQTARGLDAVHAAGLIHADVKPGNVLVGPAFRVCVSDFGLATARTDLAHKERGPIGTPAYMAPEQVKGTVDPSLAHRVDVYSLGVMAFELLTGRLPFLSPMSMALMRAQVDRPPPTPSEVLPSMPAVFDNVILGALAKDPEARTPSCGAFLANLNEAMRRVEAAEARAKVLVVDDDPHFRELVALHLETDFPGVHIVPVGTAAEALNALRGEQFDLALLDLDLPDLNAVEIAATVRADLEDPPPLVVVTGTGSAADWQILSSLGVRAFLLKPINRDALSVTVRRFLE